jgi:hypothetical protein
LTHLGPPLAGRQTSASYARPQVPFGSLRRRQRHLTTLHDEEPEYLVVVDRTFHFGWVVDGIDTGPS